MTVNSQIEDEVYAHRTNVTRYQRILEIYLKAPDVRYFIERQLSEEQEALARLNGAGS